MGKALTIQRKNQLETLLRYPNDYCKGLPIRTYEQIFASNEIMLGEIKEAKGENAARAIVIVLMGDIIEFFNISEPMSDRQMAMTVDLIISEYPFLQVDDIKACFRNAMLMKYGKIYNRLDGQIIMGWLQQYVNDRRLAADEISYNEHLRHKSENSQPMEIHDGVSYDQYREWLKTEATKGNKQAIELLELSNENMSKLKPVSRHKFSDAEKEKDFQRYQREYNARRRHLDAL